jgi:aspartyl-tRNA(Asn)/glutamyl-tRNA(Gln) amidotransferase subunit B
VEEKGITVSQRSKEYAHDYRYFPEPDLPPLVFEKSWVDQIKASLPELPDVKRRRFIEQYGLPEYDANLLIDPRAMADYFESAVKVFAGSYAGDSFTRKAKTVSNWLLGDFSRMLNASGTNIGDTRVTPEKLAGLLNNIEKGTLGGPAAKAVFEEMFASGKDADTIVAEKGLSQISDGGQIGEIVAGVVANNAQAVIDYRGGKQQSLGFLIGQVMKASKGRANPDLVRKSLLEYLGGMDA